MGPSFCLDFLLSLVREMEHQRVAEEGMWFVYKMCYNDVIWFPCDCARA